MAGLFRLATPLVEHQRYLADEARLTAYEGALREQLRPGDVVLDLGCGTGILGLMALRAGASRVIAVDDGAIVGLAKQIARANGLDQRVTYLRGHSTQISLPERADLVVADQMGPFALGAGLVRCFRDAAARLLKPAARTLPQQITLSIAPARFDVAHQRVTSLGMASAGLDVTSAQLLMQNMGQNRMARPEQMVSPFQPVAQFALPEGPSGTQQATLRFEAVRAGVVHGLMGCFVAQLSPNHHISNNPTSASCIDREQLCLPAEAFEVAPGDVLHAEMQIHHEAMLLNWRIWPEDAERPAWRSTFRGVLMAGEDVRATSQSAGTVLGKRGEMRLLILSLCSEGATSAAINNALWERFAGQFSDRRAARLFVAQVLRQNVTDGPER